jgi:hypothetical protein
MYELCGRIVSAHGIDEVEAVFKKNGPAWAGDCGPPQGRAGLGVAVPVGLPPPKAVAQKGRLQSSKGLI